MDNKDMETKLNKLKGELSEGQVSPPEKGNSEVEELKAQVRQLESLVRSTADAGRLMNYDASKSEKKPFRVKLSLWNGGLIVGWRTLKDELIKHPTTGRVVGESQEYEVLVDKDGEITKHTINGYPQFSEARYAERVEAEVVGKKEDFQGNLTFELQLPSGRRLELGSRFVN